MTSPVLGFLAHTRSRPAYVIGHDVLMRMPSSRTLRRFTRIASLRAEAKQLAKRVSWPPGEPLPLPIRVSDHLRHLGEFRFCVTQLIPYLRHLTEPQREPSAPPAVLALLERRDQLARRLSPMLAEYRPPAPISPEMLADLLHAPSEIAGGRLVPLKPLHPGATSAELVRLNGRSYERRRADSRSMSDVIRSIECVVRSQSPPDLAPGLRDAANEFLQILGKVLETSGPVRSGRYLEVYRDRRHQLHEGRGRFLLVHGPIRRYDRHDTLFVGLPIVGTFRRQLLHPAPAVCTRPEDFWSADGTLTCGGMCLGNPLQYRRLYTSAFTDAEAVVQWLDAGVSLASRRPVLHRERVFRRMQLEDWHRELARGRSR